MILHDLTGTENDPLYRKLQVENGLRHYDFLKSVVEISVAANRPFLSQTILKALNFHAIACLHTNAGMYRPCPIKVGENENFPPPWQLPDLMDEFMNTVNRRWEETDPFALAAFVLWRLNRIHPFINGNGRTARAACFFVLCIKSGGWLPYDPILPELIKQNREEYVEILRAVDKSAEQGVTDVSPLAVFLVNLIKEQASKAAEEGKKA